jgi:hypothetical protein
VYKRQDNTIAANSNSATVAGGHLNNIGTNADYGAIGGGESNDIAANSFHATIAGGFSNGIETGSSSSTIGGGLDNTIAANSNSATVAGGRLNDIGTNSDYSAIGGGENNKIAAYSFHATIAGGHFNDIGTNVIASAIGGGASNNISHNVVYATIPGGYRNVATNYAFAGGRQAKANHTGSFVWGDSTIADIASTNANSVTIRAAGGYRLFSNATTNTGVFLDAGGTSWSVISDRAVKKDFLAVDSREVLEKLTAVPVQRWHYQWESADATPHLGPVAQEFKAAFYPGRDDKSITTLEFDGVALAAIQGLNQKLEAELHRRDGENAELQRQNAELLKRLEAIEARLR